ncbi:MAG TPA: hypothetical protein VNG35_12235 [Gemmatimonadales bacterium]|nr:hypothetical protein [Gemmatimonadales bacterium]
MLQPMCGRLASVRATPSRADDVRTVVRVLLEFHDIPVDSLIELLDEQVGVVIARAAPAATPLEMAIARAPETNGTSTDSVTLPAAGRRRRGTQAQPTEGEQD